MVGKIIIIIFVVHTITNLMKMYLENILYELLSSYIF